MTDKEVFGAIVKTMREERNMSRTQLSELADLDRSYIVRLEKGHRSPTYRQRPRWWFLFSQLQLTQQGRSPAIKHDD